MKKFSSFIIVLIVIAIIIVLFVSLAKVQKMVVVYEGNHSKQPIQMELNHYQDSECGMVIDELLYASQVIAPDGKTWFFHDHGGMASWLKTKSFQDDAVIWVWAKDSTQWINGRTAWYSRSDVTPMFYGFGAYKTKQHGFIDFNTMQLYMLRGETIANPAIRKRLLGE
jgi:hypothetical protein